MISPLIVLRSVLFYLSWGTEVFHDADMYISLHFHAIIIVVPADDPNNEANAPNR